MAAPEVSVLLLTHNSAATLPRVLASIQAQVVPFPFEVVVVDSGSADGTLELLRNGADRLIEIREAEFNHGTTRNMGVEACRGPLVVLLVQDAEPASAQWLARLVEPLMAPTPAEGGSPPARPLAGTYGRQVPRADASAVARAYLSRYMPEGLGTRVQTIGGRAAPAAVFQDFLLGDTGSKVVHGNKSVYNFTPGRAKLEHLSYFLSIHSARQGKEQ